MFSSYKFQPLLPKHWLMRTFNRWSSNKIKTGIMMINMGGPATQSEVYPFLLRLFSDKEIFKLPFQRQFSKWIAKRRSPKIELQYSKIGGGSPITHWTQTQGNEMVKHLDLISPSTAPHKFYIGFRYTHPLIETSINDMERDGVERAVAFSQYPQFSCTTSGSSFNTLVSHYDGKGTFTGVETIEPPVLHQNTPGPIWSFIDRWPTASPLINSITHKIRLLLDDIEDPLELENTVLLFSAHSIPLSVANRGDPYPYEIAATVHAVMRQLNFAWPYRIVWQSKVGPVSWLRPSTQETLHGLPRLGFHHAILIPIAFTSDHIETLYEMDIEYCSEVARKAGIIKIRRMESLNDHDLFTQGLAQIVAKHLRKGQSCTKQFKLRCPLCTNPKCIQTRDFISKQEERIKSWNASQSLPPPKEHHSYL